MEKFSESCVIASTHTIVLIQNAFEARYLPQRDPFVVYFLLAASLILLSNEFAGLYVHKAADQCIQHAINIMTYCGETDPHANRLIFILTSFRDLVTQQRERRAKKAALLKPAAPAALAVKSPPPNHFHKPDQQQQNTQLPSPATIQPLTLAPNSHTPPAPIWPSPFKFATDPAPTTLPTTSSPSPFSPPLAYPASLTPTSIDAAHNSLSSFLDISALDQASMNFPYGPATSDDGSLGDENYNIDFDTLWTWAGAVPGSASLVGDVKGISDSSVPLFGIVD